MINGGTINSFNFLNIYLKSNVYDDIFIKRIIHCLCAAHTINLIAKSISSKEAPLFIKKYLKFFQSRSYRDYQNYFSAVIRAVLPCCSLGS